MQYKGYTIQPFRYGVIVRDSYGNYITQCANEEEAKEYIDSEVG